MLPQEEYVAFFTALTDTINTMIIKPTYIPPEDFELTPQILDSQPKLMIHSLRLIHMVKAQIQDREVRMIVAYELLKWLAKERPDIVYTMLHNK